MNSRSSQRIRSNSLLEPFLNRLQGVSRIGSGEYVALCPAHDDNEPSLEIGKEDSKVLVYCHAGCSHEEIVHALGLEVSDLFGSEIDTSWEPWDGTEVDIYTYTDAQENPLFQVVRFEMRDEKHPAHGSKKFLQRAHKPKNPDAGKKGCPDGYAWGRQDTRAVLYRLPEVVSAVEDGETIYFVEGEKDVSTLEERGLTATCLPGGATTGGLDEKVTPATLEPLRGADVVAIPDADEPGRHFTRAIAKRLHSKVDRVRVVELPGLSGGEDVTDYLEGGRATEELEQVVEDTSTYAPPPESVRELIDYAQESGDPATVFEHIDLLAKASEAEYHAARGKLKDATGINLNGLEAARQDAIERLERQRREQSREHERQQLDADGRPVIQLENGRPSREIVTDAVEAFERFNDPPRQFMRGGEAVRITTGENARPTFEAVEEALFDDLLTRAANFIREKKDGIVHSDPSLRLVRRIWQQIDLPALKEVREVPFLRPDGSVVRDSGYDEETQVVYHPNSDIDVPEIPEVPSDEDVERAIRLLKEPFQDFPFVDRASRANTLATVLTPLLRPLLNGANVPLAIFDATKQGTGKTLLADVVALMGMGRVPASMNAPSSNEEWRKQITAQLRKGEPIIVVDNVKGRLSSSALERVLTGQTWGDRILGQSTQVRLPSDALWIATGNNLRPRGEMTRRCILVRMDAEMVRPWQRDGFEHPNLREWVRANRGKLVAALLTAIRSWVEEGRPKSEVDTIGSFERWAQVTGGILQHIGIEGFLDNLDVLYETATGEEHRWSRFIEALHEWSREDGEATSFTTKQLADELADHSQDWMEANSNGLQQLRDELPEKLRERLQYGNPIARSLGKMFEYREGRRFSEGWRIERRKRDRDGIHWIVRRDSPDEDTSDGDARDNASLGSSARRGEHTPTPSAEEGCGSSGHGTGDLNSQTHESADEAPF